MRYTTIESLASGEDRELARCYFGRRAFVFVRTLENCLAVVSAEVDGHRLVKLHSINWLHPHRIPDFEAAVAQACAAFREGGEHE